MDEYQNLIEYSSEYKSALEDEKISNKLYLQGLSEQHYFSEVN
tara:strand:+ start:435 stop:563 length:129 start_codon:yes stop_codon:yes gene_type:complete